MIRHLTVRRLLGLSAIAAVPVVVVVLLFGAFSSGDKAPSVKAEAPAGRIAFAAGGSIYTISADGSGLTLLVPGQRARDPGASAWASAPSFSPDGTRIAFVRDYDIWVVDSDGGNARLLADVADWKPSPNASNWSAGATGIFWSPDGEELIYGLSRIGGSGLGYVERVSLNTGKRLRLHDESALFLVPSLLPDGNVVLSRSKDELELLQPDGSPSAPVEFSSSQNWPGPGYATGDAKGHWLVGSFGREAPILYGEPKAMN